VSYDPEFFAYRIYITDGGAQNDDVLVGVHQADLFGQTIRQGYVICIHAHEILTHALIQSGVQGTYYTHILWMSEQPDSTVGLREPCQQFIRLIVRSVIYYYEFEVSK